MRSSLFKVFVIFFLMAKMCFAIEKVTCAPLVLKSQDNNIILPGVENTHTAQIYFIHNTSQQSIWLDHPVENKSAGASAGWSSYSLPGKWSALLLNRKNFAISCAVIQPGKVEVRNCEKVISVCVPKLPLFDSKRKGSYWLVEDRTWDDLLKMLEKRGVQLE